MPRARTAKVNERIGRAVELLCDGTHSVGEVAAQIAEEFGVASSAAWRSIQTAREEVLPLWAELGTDRRVLVAETIAKATRHYRRCCKGSPPNYSAGLATLKWIAELCGVESIVKLQVQGNVDVAGLTAERINVLRGLFGLPPRALLGEPGDDEPGADDLPVRPAPAGVD